MDLLELLDLIDNEPDTLLVLRPSGKLGLIAPLRLRRDVEVIAALRKHKALLRNHLLGLRTGHPIGFCDQCSEVSMVHYRATPPKCRITPGCSGHHVPLKRHVDVLTANGAPPKPTTGVPPRRPSNSGGNTGPIRLTTRSCTRGLGLSARTGRRCWRTFVGRASW